MKHYLTYIIFIFSSIGLNAQTDSITQLEEVQLSDVRLKKHSKGQFIKEIDTESIKDFDPSLTDLLKYNSPFFLRENGNGMVSSISVRGTGASQTAVLWNGININSQLTGQTDFNTINTHVFDNISLKPGGGSVIYGSGAIGGSIHLNTDLSFNGKNEHTIQLGAGSFDSFQASILSSISGEESSLKIGISGFSSENDYPYPNSDIKNSNGDFQNLSFNLGFGQWLSEKHILKFYSNYFASDRGFSGTVYLPSNSEYRDRNFRNLLEWKSFLGSFTGSLKIAYLKEAYKYFENRDREDFVLGEVATRIAKYDLNYKVFDHSELNLTVDHTSANGEGSSIKNEERNTTGISILWKDILDRFQYEISLRQEFVDVFDSPFLFSFGSEYNLSEKFSVRNKFSRNYRIPTFNDLFWESGGNDELIPETSIQAEIGTRYTSGNLEVNLTGFFMNIDQLIRWVPENAGIWRPVNTEKVHTYGLELFADWQTEFYELPLRVFSTYSFTKSIDQETKKQLIYTPEHKVSLTGNLQIKELGFKIHTLYNGTIYTSADNIYQLEDYLLLDLGTDYKILDKPDLRFGILFRNILNNNYESLPGRIMPGRSFKSSLTLKL